MDIREQLKQIFENNYCGYDTFCEQVLKPTFGAENYTFRNASEPDWLNESDRKIFHTISFLGEFELTEGDRLLCFDVTLQPSIKLSANRVTIQKVVRKLLATYSNAFIIFHYPNNEEEWRVSYVSKGKDALDTTSAKRYTYLFGKGSNTRTAVDRFTQLTSQKGLRATNDILSAFSVESLTKQFYKELFDWYQWALSEEVGVTFPNDTSTTSDDRKIEEHIIRLITRVMFVWFIKQKKLVPDEIFEIEKLVGILKDFNAYDEKQDNYYRAILQNLFFATLNKAIAERAFAYDDDEKTKRAEHYGIKTLYRYADEFINKDEIIKKFHVVPFLNGGLFECLDKQTVDSKNKIIYSDGFSRATGAQARSHVPNILFFGKEEIRSFTTNEEKISARTSGLILLLNKYNFTVEENSPKEVEVALDPELLGKVFENLLGAYNPETKATARKQSGSFYTPREIVNYMVDESLIAYLINTCPSIEEKTIRELFSEEDELPKELKSTSENRVVLAEALKNAKIIDPACGSGAFPMGILNRMVYQLQRLGDQESNTPYAQKLHLIQNCIYGVDIQTIAVQISKLRFFISLVCEQTRNDNPEVNYGITPLPNLETKFVAANSLIGLEKSFADKLDLGYDQIRELKERLWNVRYAHFSVDNATKKHELRKLDEVLRMQIKKLLIEAATKPDFEKIKRLQTEITSHQAEKEQYNGENWVTLVPEAKQMRIFDTNSTEQQTIKFDKNKEARLQLDKLIKDKQKEIEKESSKIELTSFDNEAAQLANWNPYDQNTSSPFFDPEWMFHASEGFDIVIGNPPYGAKLSTEEKKLYYSIYKHQSYQLDTYLLFIEKSIQLLKTNGVNAFIIPNTWLINLKLETFRKYIVEQNTILNIVHYHKNVFENAVVDTQVVIFKKQISENNLVSIHEYINIDKPLITTVSQDKWKNLNGEPINIFIDENTQEIIDKIKQIGTPLSEICNVTIGMKPYQVGKGKPKQTKETVDNRIFDAEGKIDNEYRELLRGKDINKYITLWDGKRWIKYGDFLAEPRYSANFDLPEKIVIRQTSDRLIATLDTKKFVCMNNLHIVNPKDKNYNLRYILAIINSRIIDFYYETLNPEKGEALAEVKKENVEKLLIKLIEPVKQVPFMNLVDYLLFLNDQNSIQIINHTSNIRIASHIEDILNMMVYELYFDEHMKENGIDVLQFLTPKTIAKLNSDAEKALVIEEFYLWYQKPENPVRQRMLLVETRSPKILAIINNSINQ